MGHNPSRADRNACLSEYRGFLVRLRCSCTRSNKVRYYRAEDVVEAYGDMRAMEMNGQIPCEDCGKATCADARLDLPSAMERSRITVRRLVEIKVVKRPVWRDE